MTKSYDAMDGGMYAWIAWIRVALQTTGRLCGLVYLHFLFAICIPRAKYELKQLHNLATCIRWWLDAADGLMMPELAPGARMRNGPEVVTAPLETK